MDAVDPTPAFVRFCRTGDPGALGDVFDATAAELLRVASHLVADLNVAEDLVQATFLAAIEQRGSFARGADVVPWLVGILTNQAHRHRARAARRPDPLRVARAAARPADEVAAGHELTEAVSNAIEGLPERYRPVLRLHLRRGLTPQEIALDLGRAPATVRKQLQRGLEHLRRGLPVGIAGLGLHAAAGAPELSGIRARVLAQAASVVPLTAPLTLTVGGLLVMKKVALLVLSALLLVGLWSFAWTGSGVESAGVQEPPGPRAERKAEPGVVATAAERRSAVATAAPGAPEPAGRTLTVRGTVRTSLGAVVAGASIFLSATHSMGEGEVVGRADEQGRFALERVEPGRHVAAFADGWMPCAAVFVEGDPGTVQDVVLELVSPAMRVEGVVLGPDRAPVAGARVMIGRLQSAGGWMGNKRITFPPPVWLTSDEAGRFATASAEIGAEVFVHAEGLARWRGRLPMDPSRRGVELVAQLERGGVLKGVVRDGAGAPVAGAWIYVGRWQDAGPPWRVQHVRSDDAGRFSVAAVPAGTRQVSARRDGSRQVKEERSFVDGAVTAWHPILRATPAITGRVVDEGGAGLAGYEIRGSGAGDGPSPRAVRTAADGAFVLAGCEAESYTVSVYHPKDWGSYALARRADVIPGEAVVEFRLSRATLDLGSARGVVRFADGRPAGSVALSLWREPYSSGKNLKSEARTGRVRLDHLPAGKYRLDVRAPEHARFQMPFEVEPGAATDLGDIRLPVPCFIVVKARRVDGAPAGGYVDVSDPAKGLHVGSVEVRGGEGRFGPVPAGRYRLRSDAGWLPRVERDIVVAEGEGNVFELEAGVCAPVTFRFVTEAEPGGGDLVLDVTVRDAGGDTLDDVKGLRWPARFVSRAQRRWSFAPGTYTLEVAGKSGLRGAARVTVRRGDTARTVEVTLSRPPPREGKRP